MKSLLKTYTYAYGPDETYSTLPAFSNSYEDKQFLVDKVEIV